MVMDKSFEVAKKLILDKFTDSEILSAMQIDNGYIFSIKPIKTDDYILDGFFKVANDGKIEEYSPVMNPKEFRDAMNNVIYSKNKTK